jgi:maltose alpha-D-glucosyltransferase/alpha-amylase
MVRSFHYAALTAFRARIETRLSTEQEVKTLEHWAHFWHRWISARFLKAYLQTAQGAKIFSDVPHDEISALLDAFRLEKALYEVSYELNSRPAWVHIPLAGILQLLREVS